jgi:hypothetical protein
MAVPPTPSIRRRTLLAAVGTALSTAAAGCLDTAPTATTTDADSESTTHSDATARTDDTATDSFADGNSPTAATSTDPPRDGPDPFYVENHRPDDRCMSLSVRHTETDETVLDGTYTVPGAKGIAFEGVGAVGESYAVEATLDTGERVRETWTVRVCPPELRGDGLNNAGLVRIEDEDVRFLKNECDFLVVDHPETYEWDPDSADCDV